MKKKIKKTSLILLLSFSVLTLNSCITTAIIVGGAIIAAGGTYYYLDGNYIVELPNSPRDVYSATIKTIQTDSNFELKENTFDDGKGYVEVESKSDGELASIKIKSIGTNTTSITVRYGLVGDEKASEKLADKIAANIK